MKSVIPVAVLCFGGLVSAQTLPKARVADLIRKVENGVDEFQKYLERRGDTAKSTANSTASNRRRTANQSQKANAQAKKDDLDDALGDLNRSTNRLRRKFDATDTWMETKVQVQQVLDDGRRINQVVARGSYGAEAARLWGVLRAGINDLARAYGLAPLGV
jgi:transcription initiation factor TFIIIB Brf1 subunit/transcription initiation factor TFIIB